MKFYSGAGIDFSAAENGKIKAIVLDCGNGRMGLVALDVMK